MHNFFCFMCSIMYNEVDFDLNLLFDYLDRSVWLVTRRTRGLSLPRKVDSEKCKIRRHVFMAPRLWVCYFRIKIDKIKTSIFTETYNLFSKLLVQEWLPFPRNAYIFCCIRQVWYNKWMLKGMSNIFVPQTFRIFERIKKNIVNQK